MTKNESKETMKYLPFRPDMAQAWARGEKPVTRRVMNPYPPEWAESITWGEYENEYKLHGYEMGMRTSCPSAVFGKPLKPRYQVGEVVTLLTTWAVDRKYDYLRPLDLPDDVRVWNYFQSPKSDIIQTALSALPRGRLRPGRFLPGFLRDQMPRARVVSVRAERLQDITEEDARMEGVPFDANDPTCPNRPIDPKWCSRCRGEGLYPALGNNLGITEDDCEECDTSVKLFRNLWDSTNAKRGYPWSSNPWVFRYRLEPVKD